MNVEIVPIESIIPYEKNPRYHPDLQIKEMAKSIEMFGQTRPVVIDESGTILAGHGIRLALLHLGRSEVAVLRKTGMSESEKKKLVLADNKVAELGSDDYDKIMALIGELDDYEVPGFDSKVLDELLKSADATLQSYGTIPEPINTKEQGSTPAPAPESNFFQQPQPTPSQPATAQPQAQSVADQDHTAPAPATARRFITCPHCGGEIEA